MDKKILIIDDDKDLLFLVKKMLESYEYSVTCAYSSEEAFGILQKEQFNLILLDINLDNFSGFDLCKELREISSVPIIFASARTSEDDRITGLDIGGDDYLAKPYSLKELLAHVNAIMRRTYGFNKIEEVFSFGPCKVDIGKRQVLKGDKEISLSLKEFDVLAYLLRHNNTAVTRDELLTNVWGAFSEVEPSTVTVHIRWLREKLEDDPADPKYIITVYGKGYRIEGIDE